VFLTQQVGGGHFAELNDALGADPYPYREWRLSIAKPPFDLAELQIVREAEEYPTGEFRDVGAILYYLRATPWQIPDFSVQRYRARLADLHVRIERDGPLRMRSHNFLIRAVKR
jgi:hypothetical protein